MKIYFDNVDFSSRTGPNTFGTRLAKALANRGHIIADADDYDVALVFIESTQRLNVKKPFVQRLDGIWFKPDEFFVKNVGIKKTFDAAHAVVFQSQFNERQITGWWGKKENSTVIHNGVDLNEIEEIQRFDNPLTQFRERYEQIFVCSANWHAQKRFSDNVKLFEHVRNNWYPYSCLIVLGRNPPSDVIMSLNNNLRNNIYIAGSQDHSTCLKIYSQADWLFHLAWLDHCPNVVCESLACGLPVVCASDGGTSELVNDFGKILVDNDPYQYNFIDYDNPPNIQVTQLESSLPKFLTDDAQKNAKLRVDISIIAQKYEEVLSSVL